MKIEGYQKFKKKQVTIITIFLLIILLTTILNVLTIKGGRKLGGDFTHYISQSKVFVENDIQGYTMFSNYRYEMSETFSTPTFIFWGLSLILTPVIYFFGVDLFVMKLWIFPFFLLSLLMIYLLFKDKLTNINRLGIILIFALSPYFFEFKNEDLEIYKINQAVNVN